MRLDALVGADRNPKDHDLPAIIASLTRYGVIGPIAAIDERTGRMIGGHGRTEALVTMKADGDPMPGGVIIDEDGEWMVPVERGWSSRTDTEAEAVILALNQLTTAGGWHMVSLAQVLEDVTTEDPDLLETIGFTWEDMDNIIGRVDPDQYLSPETTIDPPERPIPDERSPLDDDDVTYDRPGKTHTCPACGFDFKD
jgi:hypothetical protein